MTPKTKLAHAAKLWAAISGRPEQQQHLTLAEVIAALGGVTDRYAKIVIRNLKKSSIAHPTITDWPGKQKVEPMQAPPQTETLTAPFGQPTDSRKTCEPGEWFEVDPTPIVAEIRPPVAGMPKKAKFHRLR